MKTFKFELSINQNDIKTDSDSEIEDKFFALQEVGGLLRDGLTYKTLNYLDLLGREKEYVLNDRLKEFEFRKAQMKKEIDIARKISHSLSVIG